MRKGNLLKGVVGVASVAFLGATLAMVSGCHGSSSSQSSENENTPPPPTAPAATAAAPATTPAAAPAAGAAQAALTGSATRGKPLFAATCAMCHGANGEGTAMGADLQTSKFVAAQNDAQLVAFIEKGRPASAPNNKMHMTMPPDGGNPSLTTQNLYDIVAFIRTINKAGGK